MYVYIYIYVLCFCEHVRIYIFTYAVQGLGLTSWWLVGNVPTAVPRIVLNTTVVSVFLLIPSSPANPKP